MEYQFKSELVSNILFPNFNAEVRRLGNIADLFGSNNSTGSTFLARGRIISLSSVTYVFLFACLYGICDVETISEVRHIIYYMIQIFKPIINTHGH